MAPNPLLRIRSHAKKTFGEAFGAATGVSDPRLQKIRIRNNGAGGQAATVAGYGGPGFHTWPSGHILQDNGSESASTNPVTTKKTFRGPRLCGVPSERGFLFPGDSQGLHPGLVCDAPSGHGIGTAWGHTGPRSGGRVFFPSIQQTGHGQIAHHINGGTASIEEPVDGEQ